MSLGKKERRFTIAIGLVIGVTVSSMLVKHAFEIKDQQTSNKPGNYNSRESAVGNVKFPVLPDSIRQAVPNGIVVFYEENRSSLTETNDEKVDTWVIETSGSFRSERLFVLAEVRRSVASKTNFFRASEIYARLKSGHREEVLKNALDEEKYRIIGNNSLSGEFIVQIRNFSPPELERAKKHLLSLPMVESVRFPHWMPSP